MSRRSSSLAASLVAGMFTASLALSGSPSGGQVRTRTVDCNAGGSLGAVLASLRPGDTLVVSGMCHENVVVPAEAVRLTLDGQGRATISSPVTAREVIEIAGRDITIRGFTINGGKDGIAVRSGTAVIDGNIIQNTGKGKEPGSGSAVVVYQLGYAVIINNTLQGNTRMGVFLLEDSSARIGFREPGEQPSGNVIRNNDEDGIRIIRTSSARIVGNTITNNKGSGIRVAQESNAGVADNTISGNGGDAIVVAQVSSVNLTFGPGAAGMPNRTAPAMPNAGVGVRCAAGGYVDGPLGALAGAKGAKDIGKTCIDAMKP